MSSALAKQSFFKDKLPTSGGYVYVHVYVYMNIQSI